MHFIAFQAYVTLCSDAVSRHDRETAKCRNKLSKLMEPKFYCSLYFRQEMFLIVSETYMHYLLAKNKMEPNVGVI